MILLYVILNEVKNLTVSTDGDRRTNLEILRFAQDDVLCYVQMLVLSYVILNEVKNLEVNTDDDRHTNLEILRFTQDDTIGCSPHKSLEILRFTQDDRQSFGMALREGNDSPTIFPLTSCTFGK